MEIRILLLFFLLTILTADVIAFPKSRGSSKGYSRGSRVFSGGSRVSSGGSRVSSGGSSSHIGSNSGHKSSSSGHKIGFGHESSSSGHKIGSGHEISLSGHKIGSEHESSSSGHKIGSSSTGTISSQTVHHQNKDASTSILLAERGGAARPSPTNTRPSSQPSASYGKAGTYPGSQVGKPDFTTENKQKPVPYNPSTPSIDHLSKASVVPSQSHVPTSGQPNAPYNPSHGTQNNPSWSNPHFNPNQPTPNIGFKDHLRPNAMSGSSYTPASPYPRPNYPIPGSNQHSPPYPIHPSAHSINQSHSPSHSVPSQTFGHPSSYPAHIPPPVPSTFGNPYSTHPIGGTYGPTGHSYPQQHVMAQPAAQPYIPGQTVIMVPGQQDSGRGFGQMVKEALVFSTVDAGVKRLINPYPHYVSNSRSTDTSSTPSETHVTYNNNYYYPPGSPPSASASSNVPQGNVPVTYPAITPDVSIPTIVGNNSSVTSSISNSSSVNTINNMGGFSNGFSAGNSTAGTVNDQRGPDQGTIYSPEYKISDNDLSTLTEELFAKQDFNVFKYLTLHLQSKSENVTDAALGPLIYVDPELYDYPTISVIRALYDNYEHNSSVKEDRTLEKRKKEDLLLHVFLNTNILTRAMQWLSDRGFIDLDDFEKKDTLRNIWFSQFNGATSGFERVFTSEKYGVDLLGVQDWLYFNYQESKGRIDYMGYVDSLKLDDRASLLKLNFEMDDIIRPNATIFVGTLPELEMSLYTICFYARPNDLCPVSLGGTKFNIFTHSFRYYGRDLIDLALPIF